ncbi:MAG: cysteine dioxygenase family protein [Phycisphaerales bacterium]|nr:cysteine dioxygenase family protein [Phycisphaerales bacterium]MCB9856780.1 cysteine dioxygenase family protein [Phycisphaerales bacterium]MCB9862093.1 cysteine dioxygenase family protein [Phycisphaerales bacterium]
MTAIDHTTDMHDATSRLSLSEFLTTLDRCRDRVPLNTLMKLLSRLDVSIEDVKKYARFGDEHYQRNLLHAGPAYHALVLCWRNGQRSPIHDHRGSSCGVRVIKGELTETTFEFSANGLIYPTASSVMKEGNVCGSQDSDIHQVSNLQSGEKELVTLHIYSPPLHVMGTYSLTDDFVGDFADPVLEFCHGDGI